MVDSQEQDEPISSPQASYEAFRFVGPEQPCPYLPDRQSRNEAYIAEHMDGALYEHLLGRGFRRSGRVVYRPRCQSCNECQQIRVLAERFKRSKSMRRVWNRNRDVVVEVSDSQPTEEKHHLFRRYLDAQHDGSMSGSYQSFTDFLYDSPTSGKDFLYRLGDRIVAVSVTDRCPRGISSVYTYSDPDFADRSLGTYSVLYEVEWCRGKGLPYYYLGYYVAGSHTMEYKSRFRPSEILVGEQRWIALPE